MKSKVMDRPLFKGPAVPDDQVENVGIMQGFMDEEDDLMSMLGADEQMDEDESNQVMERSPRSPEILMNNLRGDMRSMDARVEELADLVGYNAAQETPEEVLMLLQPILAQQGIGGLPPAGATGAPPAMPPQGMPPEMGGMPPPEMGMPPQGMPPAMEPAAPGAAGIEALMAPQAAPPTDQAPIQMADGGYVQRFQDGSGEEGVTPATTYPPELVKYAQEQLMAQRGAGNLRQSVEEVLPVYREILGGGDRRTMQGQALMDIAQAGLNLASGTNAQGQRLKGSFASQLAGAASGLPEKLAARAGQFQQEERAIKLAALKSAESNVEGQRKLFSQIVKSAGQNPFRGDWAYSILNRPGLLKAYSEGKTSEEDNNLIQSAIAKMSQPTTQVYTNDKGFREEKITPGVQLPFVTAAIQQRQQVLGGGRAAPTTTPAAPTGALPPLSEVTAIPDPNDPLVRDQVQADKRERADTPAAAPVSPPPKLSDLPAETQERLRIAAGPLDQAIEVRERPRETVWEAHKDAVGMHRQIGRFLGENIPFSIAGQLSSKVRQSASTIDLISNDLINALRNTNKLAEGERKDLMGRVAKLGLNFFQNEADYRNHVISLAQDLENREQEARARANDPLTDKKEKNEQENRAVELASMRKRVGAPTFVRSKQDFEAIPKGKEYLGWDRENRSWVLQIK
jgi:hypothetical protein